MNRQDLFESIGQLDEVLLERSEKNRKRKGSRKRWMTALAAMLVLAVGLGFFFQSQVSYAVEVAVYPKTAKLPNLDDYIDDRTGETDEEAYKGALSEWFDEQRERVRVDGNTGELTKFWKHSIKEFLSGSEGENIVYSPLNVYMALGMLAECTEGNSRQQILELLNVESVEKLRQQVDVMWKSNYCDDGESKLILASSLWMNEDISFSEKTVKQLANTYYASSFRGKMGSMQFNHELQKWLNEQTGNLLKEQVKDIKTEKDSLMSLFTTIDYKALWEDEFSVGDTKEGIFHGEKEITCDFMNRSDLAYYYEGEKFRANSWQLSSNMGEMWMILPDEDSSVDEVIADAEFDVFMEKVTAGATWKMEEEIWSEKDQYIVNLSLPKFDVNSKIDMKSGIERMGITDIFSVRDSDFSALTSYPDVFVSAINHGARVAVDEKGVVGAAYTEVIKWAGTGNGEYEEVDMVFDRPFIFIIASDDGALVFAGIVNRPIS